MSQAGGQGRQDDEQLSHPGARVTADADERGSRQRLPPQFAGHPSTATATNVDMLRTALDHCHVQPTVQA